MAQPPVLTIPDYDSDIMEDSEHVRYVPLDAIRLDSAMQFAGRVAGLFSTEGFKPHHLFGLTYGQNGGQYVLGEEQRDLQDIEGYPEFAPFAAKVRATELDIVRPYRLFTGRDRLEDKAGTLIPLTPPIEVGQGTRVVMAFGARHCLYDEDRSRPISSLSCTQNPNASWNRVITSQRYQVQHMDPVLPRGLSSQVDLVIPSDPTRSIRCDPTSSMSPKAAHADLAVVKITITKGQAEPAAFFYVPSAQEPHPEDNIILAGYAEHVSVQWASYFLQRPTPADLEFLQRKSDSDEGDLPKDYFSPLKIDEAKRRLDLLLGQSIFPQELAITVGRVHNHNDILVEHTASAVPGFSGAPGSLLDTAWKLVFMHAMSQVNPDHGHGLGISLLNPLCGFKYIKEVLPWINRCSNFGIDEEKLVCIGEYVKLFEDRWEEWGVKAVAERFFTAHNVGRQAGAV